jgi:hypothetical protein
MVETQLAQLATALPPAVENVNAVTTRGGKTTRDPPYPNHDSRKKADDMAEEPPKEIDSENVHDGKMASHELCDTQVLSFPMRVKKPTTDEQFNRFVEMIQQVNTTMPLMDAMQVLNICSLSQQHNQQQAAITNYRSSQAHRGMQCSHTASITRKEEGFRVSHH